LPQALGLLPSTACQISLGVTTSRTNRTCRQIEHGGGSTPKHTSVSNRWLADRLAMEVSRPVGGFMNDKENMEILAELERMLQ
jgi:hypothetical protein